MMPHMSFMGTPNKDQKSLACLASPATKPAPATAPPPLKDIDAKSEAKPFGVKNQVYSVFVVFLLFWMISKNVMNIIH